MILAVVPARGGSKGIPRKNLAQVGERALVARACGAAWRSGVFDRVYVYSDDPEIRAVGEAFIPGCIGIERPAEVSTDTATSEETVRAFLAQVDPGGEADCAMIQCTTPFLRPAWFREAVELFGDQARELDSVLTGFEFPRYLGYLSHDGRWIPVFPMRWRRQDRRETFFVENGALYLAKRAVWDSGRRIGARCGIVKCGFWESTEIDDQEDLEVAQRIAGMFDRKEENP